MAFWDSMRGYDCFDTPGPTFVRVYAHEASVAQTLADWDGTFGKNRALVHGESWYVIGPPETLDAVHGPAGRQLIPGNVQPATVLSARQDYLTTCTRFALSEAERHLRHPGRRSADAKYYARLFPQVGAAVRQAVDSEDTAALRAVEEERQPAALSAIGPEAKKACSFAYGRVGSTVQGVG